jgi:adenine-specific DNA-methyltransferase
LVVGSHYELMLKIVFYGIRVKNDKIVGFDDVLEDLNIHPSKNEVRGDEIIVYPIDDSNTEHKWRLCASNC